MVTWFIWFNFSSIGKCFSPLPHDEDIVINLPNGLTFPFLLPLEEKKKEVSEMQNK